MKMTILYLKDCGHAIAALTRVAPPAVDDKPSADHEVASAGVQALVGGLLPVRGFAEHASTARNMTQFAIPAKHLNLLTLESDDDQLLSPREYAVIENERLEVPPALLPPTPVVRTGDEGTLYLPLGAPVTSDKHVMLHLVPLASAAGTDQFGYGVFKPGSSTASEVGFSMGGQLHGNYHVLVLLQGSRPLVWPLTVS